MSLSKLRHLVLFASILVSPVMASADSLVEPTRAGNEPSPWAQAATRKTRVPEGISASDWSGILKAREAGRHAAVAVEDGFQARSPGQRWRTNFDGHGFVTTPDDGGWSWGLELQSYGREGQERRVSAPALISAKGSRVEYEWHDAVTEWYVNDARGLEHGYTVCQRPAGSGVLQFTLTVRGSLQPRVSADGLDVTFVNARGAAVLNYAGLKVFDADGAHVPACFEAMHEGLRLSVDDAGARYPLTIDPIAQQAYLKASNTGALDNFGSSLAISDDTVVVGAPGEDSFNGGNDNNLADSGAVYVFVRSGGVWSQQAILKAPSPLPAEADAFGWSVAVSGDTLVIGVMGEDSSATGVNGDAHNNGAQDSGAAWVFVRSGGTWNSQAYLKASNTGAGHRFGWSVAASGDTVVVGAYGESSNATGVNGNQADNSAPGSGAAYVFVRSGITWTQQAYLKASNTGANDLFGWSVAASGDTVAVGAYGESSSATGVDGNQADNSVSQAGAVYVFARNGTTWSQQAYLKASNTGANDLFGTFVATSADTVVVGASQEASSATGVNGNQADNSAPGSGAAYVFTRSSGVWSQQAYLKASNTEAPDFFGSSVGVSGDTVVVGAYQESSDATGVNGNQANNNAPGSGAAYVFVRIGGLWSQQAYLKAFNTGTNDHFGNRVAVSGDTVLVGANQEASSATGVNGNYFDNSAPFAGAAYVFTGLGPPSDADGDGVLDEDDACPNNTPGLPIAPDGRPLRDCNNDCLVDASDIQCIVDEILGQ